MNVPNGPDNYSSRGIWIEKRKWTKKKKISGHIHIYIWTWSPNSVEWCWFSFSLFIMVFVLLLFIFLNKKVFESWLLSLRCGNDNSSIFFYLFNLLTLSINLPISQSYISIICLYNYTSLHIFTHLSICIIYLWIAFLSTFNTLWRSEVGLRLILSQREVQAAKSNQPNSWKDEEEGKITPGFN